MSNQNNSALLEQIASDHNGDTPEGVKAYNDIIHKRAAFVGPTTSGPWDLHQWGDLLPSDARYQWDAQGVRPIPAQNPPSLRALPTEL